jgi:hypothetical protein
MIYLPFPLWWDITHPKLGTYPSQIYFFSSPSRAVAKKRPPVRETNSVKTLKPTPESKKGRNTRPNPSTQIQMRQPVALPPIGRWPCHP